jgi:hypothetical protein
MQLKELTKYLTDDGGLTTIEYAFYCSNNCRVLYCSNIGMVNLQESGYLQSSS